MTPVRILPLVLPFLLFSALAEPQADSTMERPPPAESPDGASSDMPAAPEPGVREAAFSPVMSGSAVLTARRNKAMTDFAFSARLPEDCRLSVNFEDIFRHRGLVYEEHTGNFFWKPRQFLRLGLCDVVCRSKRDDVEDPNVTEWRTMNLSGAYFALSGAIGDWKLYDRNRVEYREYCGYGTDHWKYRNFLQVTAPPFPTPFCDMTPYASVEAYWSDHEAFSGHDKWNTLIHRLGFRTRLTKTLRFHFYYKTTHSRRTSENGGDWRCTQHEPYFAISASF